MATVTKPLMLDETGQAILEALRDVVVYSPLQIVDNLTSSDASKALSAKQGKVLNDYIHSILKSTYVSIDVPWGQGGGYLTYTLPVDGSKIVSVMVDEGQISSNEGLCITPCNQSGNAGQTGYVWYYRSISGGSGTGRVLLVVKYLDI